jgi:hypothetical protein
MQVKLHIYVLPVCGAASWAGNTNVVCYGVTVLRRRHVTYATHVHTLFFSSRKIAVTP